IAEPGPIDLTRADLSDLPEREREPRAKELLAAEQLRPYDLAAGPLARCLLVRLSDTDHVLAIAMHHVICDAGSFEVILSELDAGYRAALAGEKTPPEPLEVQYADYALWQCALEASGAWERQRKFWAERLEGVTGELPGLCDLDAANGAAKPPGETIGHEFAPETAAELRRLGDGIAVTPFMIVAAAFAAALAPYAADDAESLIVGIPFDARHDRRLRPLVGMFINTLPIPLSLRAPSFHALLDDARTRLLEAYGNAELPYDAMVQAVASSRAGPGLFQTMCQLQHAEAGSVTLGDLTVTPFPAAPQPAKFDLTLNAELRGGRLTCDFTYATDRLSRRRAEEVTARFAELLANAIGDPARPVGPAPHAGAVAVAPRAGEERDAHTPGVEAPAELEEFVRGFFAEILGLPEVARDADFFALGGHSLIAIKLMRRINDSVPGKVPITLVFRGLTA